MCVHICDTARAFSACLAGLALGLQHTQRSQKTTHASLALTVFPSGVQASLPVVPSGMLQHMPLMLPGCSHPPAAGPGVHGASGEQ
jgi:hypothetical protein